MIAESGYITHKLMTSFPSSTIEKELSDDSSFWSHFSEGSLMTQLQLGISVMITTGAVASGQMPGVEMSEEGRKAVGQYGKVLMVSPDYSGCSVADDQGAMVLPNANNYLEQVPISTSRREQS